MLRIRTMTLADVPLGMRLKAQAGWNQREADWHRLLALEPEGCFVAEWQGEPVATTCTTRFDTVGWISMVLVEITARGHGIGTELVRHAVTYLENAGVTAVRLDATPLGRPVYERLGFVAEGELARWDGLITGVPGEPQNIDQLDRPDVESLIALDRRVTGTNRSRLLQRLYAETPGALVTAQNGEDLDGYGCWRAGTAAVQIGPVIALETGPGLRLLQQIAGAIGPRRVYVDIPSENVAATAWASSHGLIAQRTLTRMTRGHGVTELRSQIWASSGPEKG